MGGNSKDSASFGKFFDISRFNPLMPWKMFMPDMSDIKKQIPKPQVPEGVTKAVLKYGNRITSIPNGRKHITHDFEE